MIVDPEELESLSPEASRSIDIEEFVELAEIDPLFFDHSYYLVPDDIAARPYALLVEAMAGTGKVGIGRFVLRTKQYLAALRPRDGALVLSTLLFADEVVGTSDLDVKTTSDTKPSERELSMARQLVNSLTAEWEPEKYKDDYREKVLALIEAKAEGNEFAIPEEPERPAPVVDLMAALEASLARAKEPGRTPEPEADARLLGGARSAPAHDQPGGGRRAAKTNRVEVGGRQLEVSNLDKVLWPATGTTKGEMLTYYARIAPVLVPHLTGRAITLKRYPDGVEGASFFEKNCPSYKPPWIHTVKMGDVNYCLVEEPATVVWLANLAAIELHPTLAAKPNLGSPTTVVFDLDPGAPADVVTCARVALLIRDLLAQLHLEAWVKTSGSKGLQLYVPLNSGATYDRTAPFAKAVAQLLEKRHPELVVSYQQRAARAQKVLIDWSQNTESKTTVAVYALRARPEPTVSTPVTWDELDNAVSAADPGRLRFEWDAVLERVERHGDLMADVLSLEQELPELA